MAFCNCATRVRAANTADGIRVVGVAGRESRDVGEDVWLPSSPADWL